MALYWDGSSSWCSAALIVRMRANTSNPSKVQPRFEAISARHWPPFSERYHGAEVEVSNTLMSAPSLAPHAEANRTDIRCHPNRPAAQEDLSVASACQAQSGAWWEDSAELERSGR